MRTALILFGLVLGSLASAQGKPLSPDEAVKLALTRRALIRAATQALSAAKANRHVLGAYPASHLETGFASSPDVGGGEDLTLYLPIDVFGRASAGWNQGTADVRRAEADLRQSELDVQTEALSAFAELAFAQESLASAKQSLELASKTREATRRLVEERKIAEVDGLRSDLDFGRARQVELDREGDVRSAQAKFLGAIGADGGDFQPDWGDFEPKSAAPKLDMRPDLAAVRADADRAEADVRSSRLSYAPTFETQLRRIPWSAGYEQYGARLQLYVPLPFDGGPTNAVREAQRRRDAANLRFLDAKRLAIREIEAAQSELDVATKSEAAYAGLAEEARQVAAKVQRGYELGAASLIDVLDARRTALETQDEYASARRRHADARTMLWKAQGRLILKENL